MPQIRKLGHVVLFVRDPMASADWYSDLLGMDVVVRDERIPAAFLSLGRQRSWFKAVLVTPALDRGRSGT